MIVTVTPNPSVDRTLEVDMLRQGEVHRVLATHTEPGGKGVNVARVLSLHGVPTRAVLPLGGPDGAVLQDLLTPLGVTLDIVDVGGNTRTNVAVVEADGTTTKLNEGGPALSTDERSGLLAAAEKAAVGADWVVASGSLPVGAGDTFYAELVARVRPLGARIAVDTTGKPLRLAIAAGPDLIKPNAEELAEIVGPLPTLDDIVAAAQALVAGGVGQVIVSLGEDGIVLVDADSAHLARAAAREVRSTVGAGDCSLAGFLAGGGGGVGALRTAAAFGTASVELPGTAVPGPHHVRLDGVSVTRIPLGGTR